MRGENGEAPLAYSVEMPIFFKLPSGATVNLASINGLVPTSDGGATLHFEKGGTLVLTAEDATALQNRLAGGTRLSSTVKTAVLWLVIILATLLVYLAIHSSGVKV